MPRRPARRSALALAASAALAAAGAVATTTPAHADGPGAGTPYLVTVGDSYISGEGGRWAGNSNSSAASVDALGASAYFDNATKTAEVINRCHRSASAEAHLGGGVGSANFACSSAQTATFVDSNGYFKPGLDFADLGSGKVGQATMLQQFAATHNVKAVAVSIGGNDFNFSSIVQSCVTDFLASSSLWPDYCKDDASVVKNFTATNIAAVRAKITTSLTNVRQAMRNAGYGDGSWRLVVQTYPSPIPAATGFRYSQSGYTRQSTGGCGFWNADADWANTTALGTINATVKGAVADAGIAGTSVLDLSNALAGRRLCESTVNLMEKSGLTNWTQPGAVDKTEWVDQIRTASTATSDYYIQESLHPNYWGQLALRNCLRQWWVSTPATASCTIAGTGLTTAGEPVMRLS